MLRGKEIQVRAALCSIFAVASCRSCASMSVTDMETQLVQEETAEIEHTAVTILSSASSDEDMGAVVLVGGASFFLPAGGGAEAVAQVGTGTGEAVREFPEDCRVTLFLLVPPTVGCMIEEIGPLLAFSNMLGLTKVNNNLGAGICVGVVLWGGGHLGTCAFVGVLWVWGCRRHRRARRERLRGDRSAGGEDGRDEGGKVAQGCRRAGRGVQLTFSAASPDSAARERSCSMSALAWAWMAATSASSSSSRAARARTARMRLTLEGFVLESLSRCKTSGEKFARGRL